MASIYDLDDVERMRYALDALTDAASLVSNPIRVYEEWMELTIASLVTCHNPTWSVHRHIAWAARRVCWDVHASL